MSISFCFVFFMFCWKSDSEGETDGNGKKLPPGRQCVLMTNSGSNSVAGGGAAAVIMFT